MNQPLELGGRYLVSAIDLTSHENEAWFSAEEALAVTPEYVEIIGFFIGENHDCYYFSQAVCDAHHANLFIVPRGQILSITRLK